MERAGWMDDINAYPYNFTMIIPTNALMDDIEAQYSGIEEWALASESNAQAFVSYFIGWGYYPWSSIEPVVLFGTVGTTPEAVNRNCGECTGAQCSGYSRAMHIIAPEI